MIHFITYGDEKYTASKARIEKEAKETKWFDSITIYSPENIDSTFRNKFSDILNLKRGGGYWLWKNYFIRQKMKDIKNGDILIYMDAGCTINKYGKKRFNEYIEMLNANDLGMISFQMHHIEKKYTTRQVFEYFNIDINGKIPNTGQIMATVRIMKKTQNCINILNKKFSVCQDDPLLITDSYNKRNQYKCFIDHRHDQSISSVVQKLSNTIVLKDESYFLKKDEKKIKFGSEVTLKYPFWATRYCKY